MKRKTPIIITFILLIAVSIPLVLTGCIKDEETKEKELITNFIQSYFTDSNNKIENYKKYFTQTGYETFYLDRLLEARTAKKSSEEFNTEIKNLVIEPKDNSETTIHSYTASFTLVNLDTNEEEELKYNLHLSEDGGKWKLSENNRIDQLQLGINSILK